MFLQGHLQTVFDALYSCGVIDPVLKMDWQQLRQQLQSNRSDFEKAILAINSCGDSADKLVKVFQQMKPDLVQGIALEVARELAEFQECQIRH